MCTRAANSGCAEPVTIAAPLRADQIDAEANVTTNGAHLWILTAS
jgi:hypothetical protein